jgi:hypothetical protein
MTLCHIRTHYHYHRIGVSEIAGKSSGDAPAERDLKAEDRRGVSYSDLVFNGHDSQPVHMFLLDIVPFIGHGSSAQRSDGVRVHYFFDYLPGSFLLNRMEHCTEDFKQTFRICILSYKKYIKIPFFNKAISRNVRESACFDKQIKY